MADEPGATLRVLVIDDDEVDRAALRRLLQSTQLATECAEAGDGVEGLAMLTEHAWDCVFLDYQLPPQDGLGVLREARSGGVETPIVMLTGRGDEELVAEAMRAGATDYLTKGALTVDSLVRCLTYVTRVFRAEQALHRLASFPEQAPNPIIELDPEGRITYLNPMAAKLFPDLPERGLEHPLFAGWETCLGVQARGERETITREVQVGDAFFHQSISQTPDRSLVRVYAMSITERKRAEQELIHSAFFDRLTGLPNRALFVDRLGHALERAKRHRDYAFAVLFLDLDRFKLVNDSWGHLAGDRLLVAAAERLQRCVRGEDTVSRFGGDEFALLIEDPEDASEVRRIAERIQAEFARPFRLGEREVFTTASIGIALSTSGYEDPENLLRDADTAMYRAKAEGGAGFQVFDTEMHAQVVTMLLLETELRQAIERDQLCLYYQPIVDLPSGVLSGFEALVRWRHPRLGLIEPGEFIALAAETGIIVDLDRWVVHEVCRQSVAWREEVGERACLPVSLNLSRRGVAQGDLAAEVRHAMVASGLESLHGVLGVELTEGTIMEHGEASDKLLSQVKALGARVSVDDFGTGYSSLNSLRRLPIDGLKIDRAFVRNLLGDRESREIVGAIVALARRLGLQVVAEGVETREELERVLEVGCDLAQGFCFARPMDADAAGELIAAGRQWDLQRLPGVG